eukprot:8104192-Pyramimonas_sp.AAC.1
MGPGKRRRLGQDNMRMDELQGQLRTRLERAEVPKTSARNVTARQLPMHRTRPPARIHHDMFCFERT